MAAGQVGQLPVRHEPGVSVHRHDLGPLDAIPRSSARSSSRSTTRAANVDDSSAAAARLTRVKDVARVELGPQVYDQWCEISGQAGRERLAVFQLPGANALDVAQKVEAAMDEPSTNRSPTGLITSIPFNTTIFVEESIHEVYKTLFEAGVLVLIVILVFLQDWRAVLDPRDDRAGRRSSARSRRWGCSASRSTC